MGFPLLPQLPWYTWLGTSILTLLLLGLAGAIIALVMRAIYGLLIAAWVGGCTLLTKLTGWRLISSFGTAHWAGAREIRNAGLFAEEGLPLGTWKGRALFEAKGSHILLMGPPRSRKSWGLIMPALREFRGSVVGNDLRGELFEQTHEAREAYGPVYKFAPAELDSCSINLLDAVRWGSQYEFGDLHRLAFHLLTPPSQEPPDGFHKAAVPLLMAITLHCHLNGQGSFPEVVQWMTAPGQSLKEKLDTLLASPHPLVQAGARRTLDQSDRLRASVWNAVLEPLVIFADPLIAAHTAKSDVDLGDLLQGLQPLTLYLVMAFGDIARLGVFLGALVDTLVARLGTPGTLPRHKVLLCLDEVANLGRLPELERAVSYLQGSGTQVLMAFQNMQQVITTYGEHTPLLASVGTQIHYCPADVLTASAISAHLGQATVAAVALSDLGNRVGPHYEHARPLQTPDEVLRLPGTDALILQAGCAPIYGRKLGVPTPETPTARVTQHVRYYPWQYASAAACLVLALALWPLTHVGKTAPQTTQAARTAASAPQGWTMQVDIRGFDGVLHQKMQGQYETQEACLATLANFRKGGILKWQKVECVAIPHP